MSQRNPREPAVAVVTGASAGVGRATAVEFAARGFDVALVARGDAGLAGAAREVEERGQRALCLPADVARFDDVEHAAQEVEERLGPITAWVNNAMTTIFAPVDEVEPAAFQRAIEVTFLGQVWGTMAALERMRPRDRGTIVNVGSALAYIGIPLQSAYCAAKFACRGFFQSTRAELLHDRSAVRLCMVHLPAVNTPQFDWCATTMSQRPQPVPPIYEPELAARFIVRVALDGRRSKVVGAWNKLLVATASGAPGLADQFAAIGAWETQLADEPLPRDRPVNLRQAVDQDHDHGAAGRFGDRAGGFTDPQYLTTVPSTAATFVRAAGRTLGDKLRRYRAGVRRP